VVAAPPPSQIEDEQNLRPSHSQRRERSRSRGGSIRPPRSIHRIQEVEEEIDEEDEIEEEIDEEEEEEEEIIARPPPPKKMPPSSRPQGLEARRAPQEIREQREAPAGQRSHIPREEPPPRRVPPRSRKGPPSHLPYEAQRKKTSFINKGVEWFKNWLGPKEKWINYFLKLSWCGCLALFIHLVFSDRGVVDYYSQKKSLEKKLTGLKQLKKNKNGLKKNIKLIRKDKFYQKKLVRDHLGFISKDEFLILFQKGKIGI
jgi:cell division protein FtsB